MTLISHVQNNDVSLYERATNTVRLVSHNNVSATTTANGVSDLASISADGAYVAFPPKPATWCPAGRRLRGVGRVSRRP